MTLADVKPWIDEAAALGVRQFSFTGGEPFIVKDMVGILRYASNFESVSCSDQRHGSRNQAPVRD